MSSILSYHNVAVTVVDRLPLQCGASRSCSRRCRRRSGASCSGRHRRAVLDRAGELQRERVVDQRNVELALVQLLVVVPPLDGRLRVEIVELRLRTAHDDRAAGGVLAVQHALRTAVHFDLIDVEHVDRADRCWWPGRCRRRRRRPAAASVFSTSALPMPRMKIAPMLGPAVCWLIDTLGIRPSMSTKRVRRDALNVLLRERRYRRPARPESVLLRAAKSRRFLR